ncbi:hypothetical protein Hanom_Chr09g00831921 [Helianthus anomalus]
MQQDATMYFSKLEDSPMFRQQCTFAIWGKSESALILTLFYYFCENNVKSGRLIMHHVVALMAERQKGTCTNRSLSRLLSVMCLMSKA